MNILTTEIPGVLIIEPRVFMDGRGSFSEVYQRDRYGAAGITEAFVQDNVSRSSQGTLRGLHYQLQNPQGKLCFVTRGEVFDVAVDLRRMSPTFGRWVGAHLSDENSRQVYIPPGFAHGFCVLSEVADFYYKCTDFYDPTSERTIVWNDAELAIDWPIDQPQLSEKDKRGSSFATAPCFEDSVT